LSFCPLVYRCNTIFFLEDSSIEESFCFIVSINFFKKSENRLTNHWFKP